MRLLARISAWLKEPLLYDPVKIPARATFPIDQELEYRQRVARATADSKVFQDQPDYPIG